MKHTGGLHVLDFWTLKVCKHSLRQINVITKAINMQLFNVVFLNVSAG